MTISSDDYEVLVKKYASEFVEPSVYPIPMYDFEELVMKIDLKFLKQLYKYGYEYKSGMSAGSFNPYNEYFAVDGEDFVSIPENMVTDYVMDYLETEGLEDDFIEYCKDHGYYDEDDEDDEE